MIRTRSFISSKYSAELLSGSFSYLHFIVQTALRDINEEKVLIYSHFRHNFYYHYNDDDRNIQDILE